VRSPFPAVFALGLVALAAVMARRVAGEEPPRATAKVECAHASEPGRVRCEVETRAAQGSILKWADVVVAKTPPFASALRGRVGPLEASVHEETIWRWAIALAARARGTGEIVVRVRIVSCAKDACEPSEIEARGEIGVGD
jgi:hypothetical protein